MHFEPTVSGVRIVSDTGPIPIPAIFGVGLNYAGHAKEQGSPLPQHPLIFMKNPMAASVHEADIIVPKVCQDREQTDFEGELAIVIGFGPQGGKAAGGKGAGGEGPGARAGGAGAAQRARDIPKDEALSYVLGFTCANDVSARWWQKQGSGGQFCRGKGFDTFCPLGPRIVPPREVPDANALRLVTRVNGAVMQDSTTADMIFSVETIVSELSRGTTLLPGTVILTGTPSGVGMARTPPAFLKHGDVVEVEIERLGTLRNRVRFE